MYEADGRITHMCKVSDQWNIYEYTIKNIDTNGTDKYTYYANNKGNNENGLNNLYNVKIKYDICKNNKGYNQNVIKLVTYGNIVTDMTTIKDLMLKKIKFTKLFAEKIIKEHGENTLKILLDEPEKINNIKHKNAKEQLDKLKKFLKEEKNSRMSFFLSNNGILSKYHNEIIEYFKSDIDKLMLSIYDMCIKCKVPFKECDIMALKNGYGYNDKNRMTSMIHYMYRKSNKNGNLYLTYKEISQFISEYVEIPIKSVLVELVQIMWEDILYYTTSEIYDKEKKIEKYCNELRKNKPITEIKFNEKSAEYVEKNATIDPAQSTSIGNAVRNCISIVTGCPGTGKTYAISKICEQFIKHKVIIYILAPTGTAIERIKSSPDIIELCKNKKSKITMKTIHSFIGWNNLKNGVRNCDICGKNTNKLCKCEDTDQPIHILEKQYDEIIFFIDEMSMVPMHLFYDFLKHISNYLYKSRLILAGDKNQLPSIEGGNILSDLIEFGKIEYVTLTKQNRQKQNSKIIKNAQLVLEGKDIEPDGDELQFIETDYANSLKKIGTVIRDKNIRYENSAVITPVKKAGICTNKINERLQKRYNPNGDTIPNSIIKIGDKVIQTKNNNKKEIYNGSVLIVDDINNDIVKCKYYKDDNKLGSGEPEDKYYVNKDAEKLGFIDMKQLDLAYAITIHKSQGKGYDDVIVIIHSSAKRMLNKKLLYTAMTRAKERCIIIGDKEGLEACKKDIPPRITNLFKDNLSRKNENIEQLKNIPISCSICYHRNVPLELHNINDKSKCSICINEKHLNSPDFFILCKLCHKNVHNKLITINGYYNISPNMTVVDYKADYSKQLHKYITEYNRITKLI